MTPYQNSQGQWIIDRGGARYSYATELETKPAVKEFAMMDEITNFVKTLVGLIVQMYSIQKRMLILLDTFSKKKGPALVMAAMVRNAQIAAQNAAIDEANAANPDGPQQSHTPLVTVPSNLGEMADALVGADFCDIPGMDAPGFAKVMATCYKIITSISDEDSAVMYSAMPLVTDN